MGDGLNPKSQGPHFFSFTFTARIAVAPVYSAVWYYWVCTVPLDASVSTDVHLSCVQAYCIPGVAVIFLTVFPVVGGGVWVSWGCHCVSTPGHTAAWELQFSLPHKGSDRVDAHPSLMFGSIIF